MEFNTNREGAQGTNGPEGKVINVKHLLEYLRRVGDGRKRRGIRYPLEVILVLFILAKLCGENKVYGIADWVQQRSEYLIEALGLKLKRKQMPHHSTYRRVLAEEVKADELEEIVSEYLQQTPKNGQDVVMSSTGRRCGAH